MERILNKLNLGLIYRKTNPLWKIEQITKRLGVFSNKLNLRVIDLTENNEKNIPSDLHAVVMYPAETDMLAKIIQNNNNLFWVHSMFSGVEKFLAIQELFKNDNISLTNAKGAFGESLSEFAIFSMLYFSYNATAYIKAFNQKKWIMPINNMIKGKTLVIVGYGLNGSILAKNAKLGHNMNIIAIKKNINYYEGKDYVDEVCHIDKIEEILPKADFVVNFLPNTPETIDFYDKSKFELMKDTSVFINLGRGSSVNEDDLIRCLREKLILGASLDVFKTEPLPSDSPFYDLDNVFISCHNCDVTGENFNQACDVLVGNIENYFNQGKLRTYVDKKKGY